VIRWIASAGARQSAADNADRYGSAALLAFALHVMLLALPPGCAAQRPGLEHAVATSQAALHGIAIAAGEAAPAWADQVDARIAYCRRQNLPDTQEARAQCMGVFGKGDRFEEQLDALREAYDEAAEAAQRMREAAADLDAMLAGDQTR